MLGLCKGLLSSLFLFLNTLFWCLLLYGLVVLRVLCPFASGRAVCTRWMAKVAECWIAGNGLALAALHDIRWDIRGNPKIAPNLSYLVSANHQSWVDIVILQKVFNHRIPFIRFFIKQELVYVPLLGIAWWALDFPRMKRYSREFLDRHPEKRGEDLATTRRICERFRGTPISVLNFLEGTRFSSEKHRRQASTFKNLLRPKTGGLAFVIESMGTQFHSLLDITIFYPEGAVSLWGLLSGKLKSVIVEIDEIVIPSALLTGSYLEDPTYREQMQDWVFEIWQRKDLRLEQLKLGEYSSTSLPQRS